MFYHFLYPLKTHSIIFNVFKYITFRAVGASVTAFLLCLVVGPWMIERLRELSVTNDTKRAHADKIHQFFAQKEKVPTMGGILVVTSVLLSCFLWGNFSNSFFNLSLFSMTCFCVIGYLDDTIKLKSRSSKGLSGRVKLISQLAVSLAVAVYLYVNQEISKSLYVPFFKHVSFYLGLGFIPFAILVVVELQTQSTSPTDWTGLRSVALLLPRLFLL